MTEPIIEAAKRAGEAILEFCTDSIEVNTKGDGTPVTEADLAAHKIITDALSGIDPGRPVISEESAIPAYEIRKDWPSFWLVDPLDGTKEFIKHNGEFTVNIALIEQGVPVLGVVYIPVKKQLYYATAEGGAYKQEAEGAAARIYSKKADPSRTLTLVRSRSHSSAKLQEVLVEQGITVGDTIQAGSSLKFCFLAEGKADIYARLGPTMEWDVAAGDCVYRYSAREGSHKSPLVYNKPTLKNDGFIIGL